MGVVTVRPNSSNSPAGWTIVGGGGGASLHGVLADDSDSSYVLLSTGQAQLELGFTSPSIPTGALVKQASLRTRTRQDPSGAYVEGGLLSGGRLIAFRQGVTWPSPSTVTTAVLALGAVPAPSGTKVSIAALHARLIEAYLDFVYVAKPVPTVVGPGGTLTTSNRPTVAWTRTIDPDGGGQTHSQVKVYGSAAHGDFGSVNPNATVPLTQSGIVASTANSWRSSVRLPNDTYRVYVRVAQTVGGALHWSDWAHGSFTVNVALPAVPQLAVTAQDAQARVQVNVTETAGAANTDRWEVEVSVDGATFVPFGSPANPSPGGPGATTIWHYEGANGQQVLYRARAIRDHGDGLTVSSDWSTPIVGGWSSPHWWLKHLGDPSLNMPVSAYSQPGFSRPDRMGVFQGLGARHAVVVSDYPGPPQGQIIFDTDSNVDRSVLDAHILAQSPVLIQAPPGAHWTDRWVRLSAANRAPIVDKHMVTTTLESFDWIEVPRPSTI